MRLEAKIRHLQSELSRARAVNDNRAMLVCLKRLEELVPNEPTYPHQLGDLKLKQGAKADAVEAYERAVTKYADRGYLARAMAMAKTLLFVDPSRTDVLTRLEQVPAQELRKRSHPDFALPAALRMAEAATSRRSTLSDLQSPATLAPPPAPSGSASSSASHVLANVASSSSSATRPIVSSSSSASHPIARITGSNPASSSSTLSSTSSSTSSSGTSSPITSLGRSSASSAAGRSLEGDVGLSGAEFQLHRSAGVIDANEYRRRREQAMAEDDPTITAERLAMMPLFPLFSDAPREAIIELVRRSELVRCEGSKRIVRAGDPASGLYAIVEGKVRVVVPGHSRREPIVLGEGEVFGESCLLSSEPRRADVFSDGHVVALYFSKQALQELVVAFPRLQGLLLSLLARRLLANFVESSPLFSRFDANTKLKIAREFKLGRAGAGTQFVSETQPSQALVIPLTGQVVARDLRGPHSGRERKLRPGTAFGHEALLGQSTLPYRAEAAGDLIYLRLDAQRYNEIVREYPPFREELAALPIAATRSVA